MKKLQTAIAAISALLAACGCSSSQPAAVPPPSQAPVAPSASAPPVASPAVEPQPPHKAVIGTTTQPPQTPVLPPAATSPAPTADNLRDLAARYLESDGAGGWRVNEQAALELEKLGPDATRGMLSLAGDMRVEVRRGVAYYLLGRLKAGEADQIQALSACLEDADGTVRSISLSAVRQMHTPDQVAAVPRVAALLDPAREDKPANRESAARMLASLKTAAGPARDKLSAAASSDPVASVRSACLIALAQVAEPAKAAPLVARGLADKEAAVRLVAAVRLRQMGAESAPASKELAVALNDSDSRVRAAAAEALVKVGQPGVADIAEQLITESLAARKLALYCLAKIGPSAKEAAPLVEKCLTDSDTEVQKLAAAALASIGGK